MDLNTRVDHMDEEMKLLKNEIKQVLLEIQEQVLNAQNPFNVQAPAAGGVQVAPPAPRQPAPEPVLQAASAPQMAPIIIDNTRTIGGGEGAPPAPGGGVMGSVFPAGYQPSAPGGADDLGNAGGPGLAPIEDSPQAPPTQPPASSSFGGSPFGSPLSEPVPPAPIEEVTKEDEGPTSPPKPEITPAPDEDHDEADPVMADGPSLQDETNELREAAPGGTDEANEDEAPPLFSEASEEPESTFETVSSKEEDVLAPKQEEQQSVMNLVTIAGLAQWTHRVLNKVGRENLESILEVSELTGRIPKETKEVLIALVPLFEARESDECEVSAKEVVSLLAQLDGFLGHMSPDDTKLFPFLLQDESEVFPLIQP